MALLLTVACYEQVCEASWAVRWSFRSCFTELGSKSAHDRAVSRGSAASAFPVAWETRPASAELSAALTSVTTPACSAQIRAPTPTRKPTGRSQAPRRRLLGCVRGAGGPTATERDGVRRGGTCASGRHPGCQAAAVEVVAHRSEQAPVRCRGRELGPYQHPQALRMVGVDHRPRPQPMDELLDRQHPDVADETGWAEFVRVRSSQRDSNEDGNLQSTGHLGAHPLHVVHLVVHRHVPPLAGWSHAGA